MIGRAQASANKSPQGDPKAEPALKRPLHQREKGLWNFLTWSFFLSQIVAAQHLTSSSAQAAEAASDDTRVDTAPDAVADPAALAALAFLDPAALQQALALAAQSVNAGQTAAGNADGFLVLDSETGEAGDAGAKAGVRTVVLDELSMLQESSSTAPGGDSLGGNPDIPGSILDPIIPPLVDDVLEVLDPILDPVIDVVADVVGALDPVIEGVVAPVIGAVDDVVEALVPLIDGVVAPVAALAGGLVGALEPVVDGVVAPVAALAGGLVGALEPVVDGVVTPVAALAGGLVGALEPVVEGVVAPVAELAGGLVGALEPVVDGVVAPVAALAGGLVGALEPVVDGVVAPVAALAGGLVGALEPVVEGVVAPVAELAGGLVEPLEPIIGNVLDPASTVSGSIADALSALGLVSGGTSSVIETVAGAGSGLLGAGGLDDLFSGGGYTEYNLALQAGASGSSDGAAASTGAALDTPGIDLDLGALVQLGSDENESETGGLDLAAILGGGGGPRLEWHWL